TLTLPRQVTSAPGPTSPFLADPLVRSSSSQRMSIDSRQHHSATPIVQCQDLSVHYEDRSALRNVTLDIYPGEILGLLGPNGAGKSTLLKVIAGMLPASHGEVRFRGEPINGATSCITYVPQRSDADWTFPISVLDATLLGLAP